MGLHVLTKYEIKYEYGKWDSDIEDINLFLHHYCPRAWYSSEEDVTWATCWEIDREDFNNMIIALEEEEKDNRNWPWANLEYSRKEIIEIISSWKEKADPNNDFIRLEWF